MIAESDLYDVECPACGSGGIEVKHWEEHDPPKSVAKARCDCGFTHHDSYTDRELHAFMSGEPDDDSQIPVEQVHNEEPAPCFEVRVTFSPRLFLAQADVEMCDGIEQSDT